MPCWHQWPSRVPRGVRWQAQGTVTPAGIMGCDAQFTFPPLPRDRYPSSGHPLPDLPPHHRVPAREGQRNPDRTLPPRPSRSARPPFPVAGHGDPRTARRCRRGHPPARDDLAAGLGPTTPAITQRSQSLITAHTKRRSIRTRRGSLLLVNGTAQIECSAGTPLARSGPVGVQRLSPGTVMGPLCGVLPIRLASGSFSPGARRSFGQRWG